MSILQTIVDDNRSPLQRRMREFPISELESMPGFERAPLSMVEVLRSEGVSIIAEIKHRSPSKGILNGNFNPKSIARQYEDAGASAISVLTEPFHFGGDRKHLEDVRSAVGLPLLRKDFLFDPYHAFEAKAYGADAILLIAEILDPGQFQEIHAAAEEIGLQVLVELHDSTHLEWLDLEVISILGVNNRNLRTFDVNIRHAIDVLSRIPDRIVRVAESGIRTAEDLALIGDHGIDAALIGEAFMSAARPGDRLQALRDEYVRLLETD